MKCILQRVSSASVAVDGQLIGQIEAGFVALVGVAAGDTMADVNWLVKKITECRVFNNAEGKFDQSLLDVKGDILVVSQFTLLADCKKGRRPNFTGAAAPDIAAGLVADLVDGLTNTPIGHVATGQFGANMQVHLVNDGPVTIPLDSRT